MNPNLMFAFAGAEGKFGSSAAQPLPSTVLKSQAQGREGQLPIHWGAATTIDEVTAADLSRQICSIFSADLTSPKVPAASELSFGQSVVSWEQRFNKTGFVLVRMGDLFFMDPYYYAQLPTALKSQLGRNAILLNDMKTSYLAGEMLRFTLPAMLQVFHAPVQGRRVIDAGAGDGILTLIALKRGALEADLIETHNDRLVRARESLRLNGYLPNAGIRHILDDLADVERVSQSVHRSELETVIFSNIGKWHYEVTNQTSMKYISAIPRVVYFVAAGYVLGNSEKVPAALAQQILLNDHRAIQGYGFTIERKGAMLYPPRTSGIQETVAWAATVRPSGRNAVPALLLALGLLGATAWAMPRGLGTDLTPWALAASGIWATRLPQNRLVPRNVSKEIRSASTQEAAVLFSEFNSLWREPWALAAYWQLRERSERDLDWKTLRPIAERALRSFLAEKVISAAIETTGITLWPRTQQLLSHIDLFFEWLSGQERPSTHHRKTEALAQRLLPLLPYSDPALATLLPQIDDWHVYSGLTRFPNRAIFQARVEAIARYSPRAAALYFSMLGPHLRRDFNADDLRDDVPLYPILMAGFIPQLRSLLSLSNPSSEEIELIERYSRAFLSGLFILPYGHEFTAETDLEKYKTYFATWSHDLKRHNIDLADTVAWVVSRLGSQELPPNKIPEWMVWAGHVLANSDLIQLHQLQMASKVRVSAWSFFTGDRSAALARARLRETARITSLQGRTTSLLPIYNFLLKQRSLQGTPHSRESRRLATAA